MRPGATLAAWLVALAVICPAGAHAQDAAANQRAFMQGLQAAGAGDYPTAIRLLSAVAAETDEARVRLELARVYFSAGEYARSQEQFLAVYQRDIPYPVRRMVNLFLDDIDQRLGYLRPQIGLVLDNNPGQSPRSGTYEVLGIPLQFESDAETAVGVSYRLDGLLPLAKQGSAEWQLVGSVDGLAFDLSRADREAASLGLRYNILPTSTRLTLGWRGFQTETLRSSAPFIEYFRRWTPKRDRQISLQASAEINRYLGRPDLAGATGRLAGLYARDLTPNISGLLAAGGAVSDIRDSQFPQRAAFAQAGLARSLPKLKANVTATATLTSSRYGLSDPFFGKTRRDVAVRLDLAVYYARPLGGFFPGVVFSYDERRSNIDFYGYDSAGVSMDFRRRF